MVMNTQCGPRGEEGGTKEENDRVVPSLVSRQGSEEGRIVWSRL